MKVIIILFLSILLYTCGGNASNLSVGDKAPNFTLSDYQNKSYTLSDYFGKSPVVIYFYPKANTSGCTKQACGIRDSYESFESNEIVIIGISVDPISDIKEFVKDHNLNFPLLSDQSKEISNKYEVLNKIGMSSRVTFIVDKEGKLSHIIRDVDVDTHASQVFELASKLL